MKRIDLMLRSLVLTGGLIVAGAAQASGGHAMPYKFEPDTGNQASLQRGARNFMNYCSGCHSLQHLRYGRLANDLGIPEDVLEKNLMFTSSKSGDPILSSMPKTATSWFGAMPPDLTLAARARGPDWVYNYLMTFYVDDKRPLGTNNLMLPGASMPNVLGALQGVQVKNEAPAAAEGHGEAAAEGHGEAEGHAEAAGHGAHAAPFKLVTKGELDEKEFQKFVSDTVNFLVYAAEPGRLTRVGTGMKAILFLLLFTWLAYLLKREYWKDVH